MDTKDTEAIKKVIDTIAKKDKKLLETVSVSMYWNILCTTAAMGNVEIVKYILDKWVDINSYIADKSTLGTALMNAVYEKKTDVVKLLLERKADPNICISQTRTPLSDAASLKDKTIYDLLVGAWVDFTKTNTVNLLVSASQWGNMAILSDLVENRKMDINASLVNIDWIIITPLRSAIESLNFNVAEYLVDKWATATPEILALTKMLESDPRSGVAATKFLKKIENVAPAPTPNAPKASTEDGTTPPTEEDVSNAIDDI